MAKPDEERSDGLEIISIGALYEGPWEKKYWSSSRGKDRYPYPVGYQAVRTHNMITYTMEIIEGLKGPLFKISSSDGQSNSGQTPDIAWESFERKGCPRMKLWHGKRFSGKIDGVEFFGFKNPFVQRLLRELVANVSGTAELSLLSSDLCNGASGTKQHTQSMESCREFCTDADLLPQLGKPHFMGKRTRTNRITEMKSKSEASIKKLRSRDWKENADSSNRRKRSQKSHKSRKSSTSSSNEKHDSCNSSGVLPASPNFETLIEEEKKLFSAKDGPPAISFDFSEHPKEECLLPKDTEKLLSSENFAATEESGKLSKDKEYYDRSKVAEGQGSSSLKPVEKEGETFESNDQQTFNDVDLCAPDTLDFLLDNTSQALLDYPKESLYDVNQELIAAHTVMSENLGTESYPEDEMATSTQNVNSDKRDCDSVGHEIAKSMIKVLLPRALPLLKTFSKKKKAATNLSRTQLLTENLHKEQLEEKVHVQGTDLNSVLPSCGEVLSTVPHCLENDLWSIPVSDQLLRLPNQTTLCQDTCRPETMGLPASLDASQGSTVSRVETSERKVSEDCLTFNKGPQRGDTINSIPGCTAPIERVMCTISEEKSVILEVHSERKETKTLPGYTEATTGTTDAILVAAERFDKKTQQETMINTERVGTFSVSCNQAPDIAPLTRESNPPFSESIICRNFRDVCASETCASTKNVLASVNCRASSCLSSTKRSSFSDEATLDGQPHESHFESTLIKSEDSFCNVPPVAQHCNDTSETVSRENINPANSEKELLSCQDLVELDGSMSWLQNQGASFCENVNKSKEVKDETKTKCNGELKGVLELVGCYVHPMPISLVLLRANVNEIHICVLCGYFLEDRTMFIYKAPTKREGTGAPTFSGYASLMMPASRDAFGREVERILLSRFSAPSTTVVQFLPISLFRWQSKDLLPTDPDKEKHINGMVDAIKLRLEGGENHAFLPKDGQDVAIWLLISTVSDPVFQHGYQSIDCQVSPIGLWRLAVVVKNTVIMGDALDPRAAMLGASAGHGIMGTCDGLVYMWELTTGNKIGNLHCFEGSGVSCIATDDSSSGALAVAGDGGQLQHGLWVARNQSLPFIQKDVPVELWIHGDDGRTAQQLESIESLQEDNVRFSVLVSKRNGLRVHNFPNIAQYRASTKTMINCLQLAIAMRSPLLLGMVKPDLYMSSYHVCARRGERLLGVGRRKMDQVEGNRKCSSDLDEEDYEPLEVPIAIVANP
ncbi:hypothetical protein RJ640_008034 [Escallonia rubra]|uniref:Uncharacterized protein n=1 Tax=Escallonia rubra TaxID=112253 RepID=A0AA88QRM0_9ASTE|nr:hypothetical protein RJ640_008034 [Escallonia rubra]